MTSNSDEQLKNASEHWHAGRHLEAGELLFLSLPEAARPIWAAGILRAAVQRSGIRFAPVERVLHIADHPAE